MSGLIAAGLLPLLAVLGLNRLIRRSLAAPRVPEAGEPDGLPWQAVRIATLRGRSLFGWFIPAGERAPALLLASRRDDLAAVISLAAFAHPAAMMRRWLAGKGFPYFPVGAYILWYVQRVIGHRFDDIAPCHTIARVRCPVLIAHGSDDGVVPVSEAEQIYASRGAARARLLLMPGSHDEYADLERHLGALVGFLDEAMGVR